jgi:glycosyltransferase involved in cell wall biosynthesis
MIDIIIPAYNVDEAILTRCLSSIVTQTILNQLKVTIVDDGSDEGYNQIYHKVSDKFKELGLDIVVLWYPDNRGPGQARQYGIDNTNNEYLVFIDADDVFANALSLQALSEIANNTKSILISTAFNEVVNNNGINLIPHENDLTWMFGKLYSREFITKYNIRFHPTSRANEDNGFNTLIRLISSNKYNISFNPLVTYYWMENKNSITRRNDNSYSYGDGVRNSFHGYIENMLYALSTSRLIPEVDLDNINKFVVSVMVFLYKYYSENLARSPKTAHNNFLECKKFYNDEFINLKMDNLNTIIVDEYNKVMSNLYKNTKLEFIPSKSINQFLSELDNYELTEEDKIYYESVGY